jgi:hypothetical protein
VHPRGSRSTLRGQGHPPKKPWEEAFGVARIEVLEPGSRRSASSSREDRFFFAHPAPLMLTAHQSRCQTGQLLEKHAQTIQIFGASSPPAHKVCVKKRDPPQRLAAHKRDRERKKLRVLRPNRLTDSRTFLVQRYRRLGRMRYWNTLKTVFVTN